MDKIWQILDGNTPTGGIFTPESVLMSLILAFVLGQVLAWVYYFTHSGLSYSKSFVQSLVLITIVVAMVMSVIGNSIITAVGLMGALAIVRFRNMIKDTRDIAFIFCSLVIGMATGSQRFSIAIIGTVFLCLIAMYLHFVNFGTHRPHNGFLRFTLPSHLGPKYPVAAVLKRFCKSFTLVSVQDIDQTGSAVEFAYQLMIKNAKKNERMITELETIEGINNINLTMQEQLLEI